MFELPLTLFQKLALSAAAKTVFATSTKVDEIVAGREVPCGVIWHGVAAGVGYGYDYVDCKRWMWGWRRR